MRERDYQMPERRGCHARVECPCGTVEILWGAHDDAHRVVVAKIYQPFKTSQARQEVVMITERTIAMKPDLERLKGKSPERQLLFVQEWLVNGFTEQLSEAMQRHDISKSALAAQAGVSQPYITKVLRGENVTLRTAAKLAWAVGHFVDLALVPAWQAAGGTTHMFPPLAAKAKESTNAKSNDDSDVPTANPCTRR